jgi:hypothetical protein
MGHNESNWDIGFAAIKEIEFENDKLRSLDFAHLLLGILKEL